MSKFVNEYSEWQKKMIEEHEHGTPLTYSMMRALGMLKPYTFRLPPHVLAQLDEMDKMGGPWDTKGEMLYMIVQGAIQDFLDGAHETIQERFAKASQKALEDYQEEIKERSEAIAIGHPDGNPVEDEDGTHGPRVKRMKAKKEGTK